MKLVVIGASGNVGTAFLRRCAAQPGTTVTGVSRRRPPGSAPYDTADWVSLDIAGPTAADALTSVFADADAVINLAWGFQPGRDEAYLEAVGVGGLRAVLSAVVAAGVPHVVQMSSVGAYAPGSYGTAVDESYPTTGIPTSPYSRHKAAAERLLDAFEVTNPTVTVTRPRPGLVMSADAGSSLLRYGLPPVIPGWVVGWLPVLPLDAGFQVPVVHADDVAAALSTIVARRVGGAFNLSAAAPLDRAMIASAMHARPLPLPRPIMRGLIAAGWRLHLQRLDPGWIDLAFAVPLQRTERAGELLNWEPARDTQSCIAEVVQAMTTATATASPVLRRRSVGGELADLRRGPATRRRLT